MATNNAPKHDFAPAWLKIPNAENAKPPGNKQGKRFLSGTGSKFRHHSVDDDYYAYSYSPYGYYSGYPYPDKYGMHYNSQPSMQRVNGQRDAKYQHPHARFGTSQGMNVAYPSYYDFIPPYDYYGSDPYYTSFPPGRSNLKRNFYEKEGRSNSREGKEKEEKKDKDGEKEKPFTDDFPSLNGEEKTSPTGSQQQLNGNGVWENPPISKAGSGKPGEESSVDASQCKLLRDANIYKSFIPNKSTIPRRPARLNGSYPRETATLTGLKTNMAANNSSSPGYSKEGSQPTTPPMDILNTRFVTQPKTLSDKKSHFLKALRQEDEKLRGSGESEELVNGVSSLGIHDNGSHLSSSLEAEQRLLREMGWNEADDEDYEITEDEMKEFQNLTKQVQQRNGPHNAKTIPKTWSPKHIPMYQPNLQELNDTVSSSDSDTDVEN